MAKGEDLTGQKFGRLTAIEYVGNSKWLCKCECGNEKIVYRGHLKSGAIRSCGCLHKDELKKRWSEDEEFRKRQAEAAGKFLKEKWEDEIFRDEQTKRLQDRWDEELRQEQSVRMKELADELWQMEDYREKQNERLKKLWSNDEFVQAQREGSSERMKKLWEREDFQQIHHDMSGENNPMYNPNLTDEERQHRRTEEGYKEWKTNVKELANFTCDICGKRGGDLASHHLDGYNWCKNRRVDITNGVCLCKECHTKFHKIYGSGNNTEAQYIEFKQQEQQNNN